MTISHINNNEAGSSVRTKLNAAIDGVNITAPVIDITGTWPYFPPLTVIQPFGVFVSGQFETVSGCWLRGIDLDVPSTTTVLSFDNLVGLDRGAGNDFISPPGAAAIAGLTEYEIAFPVLEIIRGDFVISDFTAIDLSSLRIAMGSLQLNSNTITTLSFPSLEYVYNLIIGSVNASADFAALSSFTMPATLKRVGSIYLNNMPLDVTSVNGILAFLVSLDGTNGTTEWGGDGDNINVELSLENGFAKAPTGQGLVDLAALLARDASPAVLVNAAGRITHYSIAAAGVDYVVSDTFTVNGTSGTDAEGTVTEVDVNGAVIAFDFNNGSGPSPLLITDNGTGYSIGSNVATSAGGDVPGAGTGLTINITRVT